MDITVEFLERLLAYQAVGMGVASWAQIKPDAMAVIDRFTKRTWAELNANANRLARLLRARGLKPGDGVALFCTNRVEFMEALNASRRTGMRITPVNWHLTASEI